MLLCCSLPSSVLIVDARWHLVVPWEFLFKLWQRLVVREVYAFEPFYRIPNLIEPFLCYPFGAMLSKPCPLQPPPDGEAKMLQTLRAQGTKNCGVSPKVSWCFAPFSQADSMDDFVEPIVAHVETVKKWPNLSNKPIFLLGHSMGGLISLFTVFKKEDLFKVSSCLLLLPDHS